ncbi:MAG: hypothetical protein LKF41_02840 [Bifidobacterium sp.]|jgi:hypothetical protein|nr:hypothetical protein [Bifidobacterium sp.]MCH4174781.1 hypothetical protein [Bifidobacterium sp.]
MSSRNIATSKETGQGGYVSGSRLSPRRIHVTFGGSIHAELVKLLSLKSSYILLIINAALIPLGTLLVAWSTKLVNSIDEKGNILSTTKPIEMANLWISVGAFVSTAVLAAGILAIMSLTSEFGNMSIQSSLTANPRRGMLMAAKAIAISALTAFSTLLGVLLAWGVAHIFFLGVTLTPLPNSQRFVPLIIILGAPVASALIAVMALGIAGICRSTVGAVFTFIAFMMIVPQILAVIAQLGNGFHWIGTVTAALPNSLMDGAVGAGIGASLPTSSSSAFDPNWWQSLLLLAVWSAASYVLGTLFVKHRDIN